MVEQINMEPRLFTGSKEGLNSEELARANRLISFQQSIERRPGIYAKAFAELGTDATAETLELHHEDVETRYATSDPKKRIKEFFAKRDDKMLELDTESDEAIFTSEEFSQLSKISREKTAVSVKTGVMRSEVRAHPEAREASNAVRRYILGAYIGRVITWKAQQESKRMERAG